MTSMLGSRYAIIASLILLSLLGFFTLSYIPASAAAEERGSISVIFDEPVAVDSVVKKVKEKGSFDTVSAQSSFSVDGSDINDFVTITPHQSASDVQTQWSNGRKLLVERLTKDNYFAGSVSSHNESFAVVSVTIYGEKTAISEIAATLPGKASEYRSASNKAPKLDSSSRPQSVSPLDGVVALAAANSPYYLSLPAFGSVSTGLFTAPGVTTPTRGAVNYMTWSSNRFASDQTYEHDFFLSADQGTYFARNFSSVASGCVIQTVYAATSWPSSSYPYLDSDLEAPTIEPLVPYPHCSYRGNIAFSIGAGQANAITAGVSHFTAILMLNGDAATDVFTLQGQVGYQYPVGSRGALTSFPYGYSSVPANRTETTHYGFIYNGSVPGSRTWTYNGNAPDAPDTVSVTNATASSLRVNFRDTTWDETSIVVERRLGSSGVWTAYNFGVLNAGTLAGRWYWTNSGLASRTQYCYRLKATNAIGSSVYSSIVCGTTL